MNKEENLQCDSEAVIVTKRQKEVFCMKDDVMNAGGGSRDVSLEKRISNILLTLGVPPHIKGYGYLREGIRASVREPDIMNRVTKALYPAIGDKFHTSASKVERAIRHAIEVAWNRGRVEAINAIFGARVYIGTEKPTNSEFIALVADKLILEDL